MLFSLKKSFDWKNSLSLSLCLANHDELHLGWTRTLLMEIKVWGNKVCFRNNLINYLFVPLNCSFYNSSRWNFNFYVKQTRCELVFMNALTILLTGDGPIIIICQKFYYFSQLEFENKATLQCLNILKWISFHFNFGNL